MSTFGFYTDPALTTPVSGGIMVTTPGPGESASVRVYFGSPDVKQIAQGTGGLPITISSGASDVVLSLPDFSSVIAGQSIEVGTRVEGGVSGALVVLLTASGYSSIDTTVEASIMEVVSI